MHGNGACNGYLMGRVLCTIYSFTEYVTLQRDSFACVLGMKVIEIDQLQLRKSRRHDMSPLCFKMQECTAFQFSDLTLESTVPRSRI